MAINIKINTPSPISINAGPIASEPSTVNVLSSTGETLGFLDSAKAETINLTSSAISFTKVGSQGQVSTTQSASGIAYEARYPVFTESFVSGDSWDNYTSGNYDRTQPVFPASYAKINRSATQADVRGTPATSTSASDAVVPTILESNNAFGNKFRFTDDQGNASNATVGSNLYAHVDWQNHDFASAGSTADYVIDHLTGWGYTTKFETDGAKFNMNTTSDGQDWAAWIAYINGTHYGYTGWMPLDLSDIKTAHGAYAQPNVTWADSFFLFQSLGGATRGTFFTGESTAVDRYQSIVDTSNPDLCRGVTKAADSGFFSRISNIFMKRKHF
tara:strand:+ start:517 stop:1506 length:990 start_codon:yes stop_codon:yes gene_type:complete